MADYLPPEYRTTPGVKPPEYQLMTFKEIQDALRDKGIVLGWTAIYERIKRGIRLDVPTSEILKYVGKKGRRRQIRERMLPAWKFSELASSPAPCGQCHFYEHCKTHDTACWDYLEYVSDPTESDQRFLRNFLKKLRKESPIKSDKEIKREPRKDIYRRIFGDAT